METDVSETIELKVHFAQDAETGRWYIAASDIPGLRVEADSAQALIQKVGEVAGDLVELNSAEILAAFAKTRLPSAKPLSLRPPVSILPVFDSPMAIAAA